MLIIQEQNYPLILSNTVLHDFHLKIKYIKHWKSKFKMKKMEQFFFYLEHHNVLPKYYLAVTKSLKVFKTKEFLITAMFGMSY